jgi:hypothetical protein
MSIQLQEQLGAGLVLIMAILLVLWRKRLGVLNVASWLVILGGLVIVAEHAQFALSFALGLRASDPYQSIPLSHARLHFFMAGIYTLIGMVFLGVIARTLLKAGQPVGWLAVLFGLLFGGGWDLVMGGLWFSHGLPLYGLLGAPVEGFGWEFLSTYVVVWTAALVLSYRPIFAKGPREHPPHAPRGAEGERGEH